MTTSPYQDKPSPWSSHSRILSYLQALPEKSKVFDVGTASGMLARRGNSSLRYFGVESNAEWATSASPFYEKLWNCSFDEMQNEDLKGYDAIVLGDVLEHMANPEIALKRLVELQSSGSLFIISVPNVANIWVRLHLLTGNFDYAERGILDRTHLRFFTRKSLIGLVENCGLDIDSINVTPIPLELISNFFNTSVGKFTHGIFASITSSFPTLLGYQFIVKAKKI
ncbi:MAG TPA: hypothetical protein DEP19_07990 [Anaerolineae bacterium]|nr:hypothetical protein [Anaerolineae bacterium]HCK65726.1 hypothetical protein [Anaerolineae bacterium]